MDLPVVEESELLEEEEIPIIIGINGAQRKILVVDDGWENRLLLLKMLTHLGFEVQEAINGQDALEKALLFQPDAISIDLKMPVMDGFEATRQIRKEPTLDKTVIIAISASAFGEDQKKSLVAGCNDFIGKPVNFELLLERLERHLRIEWVYEYIGLSAGEEEEIKEDKAMIGPPPKEAGILFELAMRGNVKKISQQITKLEELDPKYKPYVTQLRKLANLYRMDDICDLLEPYLSEEI